MPDQTTTITSLSTAQPAQGSVQGQPAQQGLQSSTLITGRDVYDVIMAEIEPELVSSQVATLDEKYKAETSKDRSERMARYDQAFTTYDRCYSAYLQVVDVQVRRVKEQARRKAEQKDRTDEDVFVKNLLVQIAHI